MRFFRRSSFTRIQGTVGFSRVARGGCIRAPWHRFPSSTQDVPQIRRRAPSNIKRNTNEWRGNDGNPCLGDSFPFQGCRQGLSSQVYEWPDSGDVYGSVRSMAPGIIPTSVGISVGRARLRIERSLDLGNWRCLSRGLPRL